MCFGGTEAPQLAVREKARPVTLVEEMKKWVEPNRQSFLCVGLSESPFPKPVLLEVPETLRACGQTHYLQFTQDNCFLCCHAPSLEIVVYPACPFICSLNSLTRSVLSPYHISVATLYTLSRGGSCEHNRHDLCPPKHGREPEWMMLLEGSIRVSLEVERRLRWIGTVHPPKV